MRKRDDMFKYWGLSFVAACAGCGEAYFVCSADAQCGDDGTCEVSGYCAFDDASCDSGKRYARRAPPRIAEQCVAELSDDSGNASVGETSTSHGGDDAATEAPGVSSTTGIDESAGTVESTSDVDGESGEPDAGSCLPMGRVETQPVLLYDFCEEPGSTTASIDSRTDVAFSLAFEGGEIGNGFTWTEDGLALDEGVDAKPVLRSTEPVFGRLEACRASGTFSVEVWVTPSLESQRGPARIVELGTPVTGTPGIDFALMSNPDFMTQGYAGVVRTSADEHADGRMISWLGTPLLRPTHVVLVHDFGRDRLYIDGEIEAADAHLGDLSVWSPNFDLVVGNAARLADRNWVGTLHLLAVYCTPLSPEDVAVNYVAGHRRS